MPAPLKSEFTVPTLVGDYPCLIGSVTVKAFHERLNSDQVTRAGLTEAFRTQQLLSRRGHSMRNRVHLHPDLHRPKRTRSESGATLYTYSWTHP